MVAGDYVDEEMPEATRDFIRDFFSDDEDDAELLVADPDEHTVVSEPSGTTDSDNATFHSEDPLEPMDEMPPGPPMQMGPPSPVQHDVLHPLIDFGTPHEFQGKIILNNSSFMLRD